MIDDGLRKAKYQKNNEHDAPQLIMSDNVRLQEEMLRLSAKFAGIRDTVKQLKVIAKKCEIKLPGVLMEEGAKRFALQETQWTQRTSMARVRGALTLLLSALKADQPIFPANMPGVNLLQFATAAKGTVIAFFESRIEMNDELLATHTQREPSAQGGVAPSDELMELESRLALLRPRANGN